MSKNISPTIHHHEIIVGNSRIIPKDRELTHCLLGEMGAILKMQFFCLHLLNGIFRSSYGNTVPDTHKFPLMRAFASHRMRAFASHRIASHAGKCAHVRAFASHARNARICAHSHPMRENARICAHSHPMRENAHICAHSHRMRGNARITTRKTRKWDCGNDASPSVLAPDPWNWVCSR